MKCLIDDPASRPLAGAWFPHNLGVFPIFFPVSLWVVCDTLGITK